MDQESERMKKKLVIGGIAAALLACSSGAFAAGAGPAWDYQQQGADWASLTDDEGHFPYKTCGDGQVQSPINIDPTQTVRRRTPSVRTIYRSVPLNVQNNGHTIQVNYAPGSMMKIGKKAYYLLQFHFHAGSENTVGVDGVDEHRAAAEVHFVHMNSKGKLGVLGVFIEKGRKNPALEAILKTHDLDEIGKHDIEAPIKIQSLLPGRNVNAYYNFPGSLTTPPCTEGVNWYVAKKPVHASEAQIQALRDLMWHDGYENYRSTQPRNDRVVREKGR